LEQAALHKKHQPFGAGAASETCSWVIRVQNILKENQIFLGFSGCITA